ncbi:hypothetical protein GCM10009555_075670 [Acrocarpospora macrocephala]|uniref:Uncharacterized protein n=1 Tax=Acrocarpospora macrocephala TaxID=150177 RepID=A0A5M3X7Z7_9ACTN|nr:hypothetical protein [Acrocarpospora macrocephala]GES16802.1 hypothetical protein Amac_104000 [Acrocarpospora macrocephala]
MSNPYGYEGQQPLYGPQPGPPPRANPIPAMATLFTLAFLMLVGGGFSLYVVLADDPPARETLPTSRTQEAAVPPNTPTNPPTTPAADPASQPPVTGGDVLMSDNGTGNKTTAQFTADASWQIHYTYDCSTNPIGTGHVSVTIKSGTQTIANPISEIGTKTDKTTPQTTPGTFTLEITSIGCTWTIEAIDTP